MWAEERHRRIVDHLTASGHIEAEALTAMLQVSKETIRRDLLHLETQGVLRRVHGGAVSTEPDPEKPFSVRRRARVAAKRQIAAAAARLVRPGQCCFIDAGTTTALLAEALVEMPDVTVVTNSVEVAMTLRASRRAADVVLLGGSFSLDVPATYGELTLAEIARFRADLAIVSPVGIDRTAGPTYYHVSEAEVARAMFGNANSRMVLADHSKLGRTSRVILCPCADIDILVTDAGRSAYTEALRGAGVKRIVTGGPKAAPTR
jgi:DeoR family transcriptional regulator, fructose operon transcriptional repressor